MLGYPQDGPFDAQPARIRSDQRLRSPNIYGTGTVTRHVFSVRGLIRPGNSGGPLVSTAGQVLGVVFAASVSDRTTGYVLTADQVRQAAANGPGVPPEGLERELRLTCRLIELESRSGLALQRPRDLAGLLDRALGRADLLGLAHADQHQQAGQAM